jgi:hypothetical protein
MIKKSFLAVALTGLMTTGAFAAAPAVQNNCYHTPWFSEEGDAREDCDTQQNYAVRGMNCRGSYCDNKQLYCCADDLPGLDPSNRIESPYFSEEGNGSYEDKTRVLTGLSCTGRYCDNISMKMYGFRTAPQIDQYWTQNWFSEEKGYDRCQRNGVEMGFVVGLACDYRYCDNLRLTCVTYK